MYSLVWKICLVISKIFIRHHKRDTPQTQLISQKDSERFQHIAWAGKGGFGSVFKTKDTVLDRIVAEKRIEISCEEIKLRAYREAQILAKLSHTNIPAIYDVITEAHAISIIFEWIDGITLEEQLKKGKTLSIESTLHFFNDLCNALHFAHTRHIYHRDIKPSNIIIREADYSCVLVDFGIALNGGISCAITQTGKIVGTPGYMAPEQKNGGEINATTDIYSLAVVLYECLAGNKISVTEYHKLSTINSEVPDAVDNLILLCINEIQAKRIQTANDFYQRLVAAFNIKYPDDISVFENGSLKDICESLEKLDVKEFKLIPEGHKSILLARTDDLLIRDSYYMRNAIARLLCAILNLCYAENNFSSYVKAALKYAFVVEYSPNWIGNTSLRKKLLDIIPNASLENVKAFEEEIPTILEDLSINPKAEIVRKTFLVEMKKIITAILGRNYNPLEMKKQLSRVYELERNAENKSKFL